MPRPRPNPYMYATWIAKSIVGEKNCLWAPWFKNRYRDYQRLPIPFDTATWNMEHTDLLNEVTDRLGAPGGHVF